MPVKVFWGDKGPYAECDTPEEAAELLRLGKTGWATELRGVSLKPSDAEGLVETVFAEINENARKFLSMLAKHNAGIKGEDFSRETGFSSDKFGGILGGASKIAKKHGVSLNKFVISEMRQQGTQKFRFLKPGPLLLRHRDDLGIRAGFESLV